MVFIELSSCVTGMEQDSLNAKSTTSSGTGILSAARFIGRRIVRMAYVLKGRHALKILLLVSCLPLSGCPDIFSQTTKNISYRVADYDTDAPISGVVAVAVWEVKKWYVIDVQTVNWHAVEAVSDEQGIISIPSQTIKYGFLEDPSSYFIVHIRHGYAHSTSFSDDTYTIMKKGDKYHRNNGFIQNNTVKMMPFEELTKEQLYNDIDWMSEQLDDALFRFGRCDWVNFPKFLVTLVKEKEWAHDNDYPWPDTFLEHLWKSSDVYQKHGGEGCPSPKAFIKEKYYEKN